MNNLHTNTQLPVPHTNFLTALIVDDEPEACRNLQKRLSQYISCNIDVLGTAHDTRSAESLIRNLNPDVVFMDIEMPGETGFELLQRLGSFPFEVIFATAYDEYAIKAFKLHAIDYLLKPIAIDDLQVAVNSVMDKVLQKKTAAEDKTRYHELLNSIDSKKQTRHLAVKDKGITYIIGFERIAYIEAMAGYSKIFYTEGKLEKTLVSSHSISEYEEMLTADGFYRIHKSYLVNCTKVKAITKDETPCVLLPGETRLPIGRRRLAGLTSFLKNDTGLTT